MAEKGLTPTPSRWSAWVSFAKRLARQPAQRELLAILLLLLAIFSIFSPPFRDLDNFALIASETSTVGIVAAAQTMVILTGGIDLSVGSMVALAGIVAASLMKGWGPFPPFPPYLAIALALVLGATVGLAHGWLVAKRNVPPFILTLGTLSVLRGLALAWTNASSVNLLPDDFKWISDSSLGVLPAPALLMFSAFIALGYTLRHTKLGRYTYAIGGNETAAQLSGVPIARCKIAIYMLSSTLAALAGIILIARLDGGFYTNGEGYELSSVAAVIIGGTSLTGGVGGVWGTLLGVLVMAVLRNGLVMVGISPLWQSMFIGGIILIAVLVDVERRRARQSPPPVQAQPEKTEFSYPDEFLAKAGQIVKERFYPKLYMVDPQSNELVENRSGGTLPVQAGAIADRAWRSGTPIILNHLSANDQDQITRLGPDVQSAVAIPLIWNGQVVGVFEAQSPALSSFGPQTVTRLMTLNEEAVAPILDTWLLTCGWLTRQIRDALRHLGDEVYLGQCPLTQWALLRQADFPQEASPVGRGAYMRRLLTESIKRLIPGETPKGGPRANRRYDVLQLTYVEGHTAEESIKKLNISRRQYFYDLKDALDTLAQLLISAPQAEE